MYNLLANKILLNIQLVQVVGFCIALIIAYVVTPLVQRRAMRLGLLDKPSTRKVHVTAIPRLGGVSVYVSLFLSSLLFLTYYYTYRHDLFSTFTLIGIFGGGTIIFFLGLLDDIEPLPAVIKLLVQILAASVAWLLGIKIMYLANPLYHADLFFFELSVGRETIEFSPLISYILTIAWIVIITNAVNLIDGVDGLATGVCLISAVAIWAVTVDYRIHQPAGALMAATLAGALLGFLRWNFNPARIFLGDSGAYLTGFVLSALAISCVTKKIAIAVISPVIILIFAFPIGDTLFAVIRRTINKKSILQPDTEHLHHRALSFGFSQKIVSYLFYLVSACLGLYACYLISLKSSCRFLILSTVVFLIALFYACIVNWKHQKIFRNIFHVNKK